MTASSATLTVTSISQVIEAVRGLDQVAVRGAGTKPALAAGFDNPPSQMLDMRGLEGIVEYEPQEYTLTALAGTRVRDVRDILETNGQYLPFDPVLVDSGATLGGTLASGLSGSGRLRYGGLRDFVLGVRFVDGQGTLVKGGGKVVKNAAGFDFPKLMAGSCGRLGVVVETSFKVFPAPQAFNTLLTPYADIHTALEALYTLTAKPVDLLALDLVQRGVVGEWVLALRIGGDASLLPARIESLRRFVGQGEVLEGQADAVFWRDASEFAWADSGAALVKVPITPSAIPAVESEMSSHKASRRYAVAGNLLWLTWPAPLSELDALLRMRGLSGTVLRGSAHTPWIGRIPSSAFAVRVKTALDPHGKFAPLFMD